MFRRAFGKVPWRTVSVLVSLLGMAVFAAAAGAREGAAGSDGGDVPRMGGGSSGGGRGFSGGAPDGRGFSALNRSLGGAGRSFTAPNQSFSGGRSFSAQDGNSNAGAGRGMSSARPPAEFRSSQPRIGNDLRASQPRISRESSPQRPLNDNLPRGAQRSVPDVARSADASGGRSLSRSADPFSGRTYSRSARDLGIGRPDSLGHQTDIGSTGQLDRGYTGTGQVGRSGSSDRSVRGIDNIARQVARPDNIGRGGSVSQVDRSAPISRSLDSVSRGGSPSRQALRSSGSDGSKPIWRTNDRMTGQAVQTGNRLNREVGIAGRSSDRAAISRAPISRPLNRNAAAADGSGVPVTKTSYDSGHWGGGQHGSSWNDGHGNNGHWDGHGGGRNSWGRGGWDGHGRGCWHGSGCGGCGWCGGWFNGCGWGCWNPCWSFSFSFGFGWWPGAVWPASGFYPWGWPYYSTFAWPVVYQPVVLSPVVAPVVVDPGFYYWNPAYSYYTYPALDSYPAADTTSSVDAEVSAGGE